MADILIRATSKDEMREFYLKLMEVINLTGGWAGALDQDDQLGELEVRLIVTCGSEAELSSIWERVKAGEEPRTAWEAVGGPNYQHHMEVLARRKHIQFLIQNDALEGADLHGAQLLTEVFRGKNMRNVDLLRALLQRVDLSGADLSGANLEEAMLEGANFTGARYDTCTRWPSGFDPVKA